MQQIEEVKDTILNELGFLQLGQLYAQIKYNLPRQTDIESPEILEQFIRDYMGDVLTFEGGIVKPRLPSNTLWYAESVINVPTVLTEGLSPSLTYSDHEFSEDLIPRPDLDLGPAEVKPCVFMAMQPGYATRTRGRPDPVNVSVVEIDSSGYSTQPVDRDGMPSDLDVAMKLKSGTADIGYHGKIDPEDIRRIFIHNGSKGLFGTSIDERVIFVEPKSNKQWNRVIAEHYAQQKV